ncbi:MAG: glycosyltransferase family 4 protein [Saprospiraceae bacterium]|nr:glycosyltransferase family 4 protein [Saprospiraceae bacterium]
MKVRNNFPCTYLIYGPQFKNAAKDIGGTTISFEMLCEYAWSSGKSFSVIRTNRFSKRNFDLLNLLWVMFFSVLFIPKCKIVFLNVSPGGMYVLAPLLYGYIRLWNKKLVIRVFGGNEERVLPGYSNYKKIIFSKIIAKADLFLLQTQALVHKFRSQVKNIEWLPTSRKFPPQSAELKPYSKKFVYVSQVHEAKGIDMIIQIKKLLPAGFTLDVYGPILDHKYDFLSNENYYKGVLHPFEVSNVLQTYDVLLFPTFHSGEGYPGVIIEALGAGLPVMCSDWLNLHELVQDQYNGFLINNRDVESWLNIILNLDSDLFDKLRRNAWNSSEPFEWKKVNDRLFEKLDSIK